MTDDGVPVDEIRRLINAGAEETAKATAPTGEAIAADAEETTASPVAGEESEATEETHG